MKKTARSSLAIAAALVLVLTCYGLARAYLYYEARRAESMIKELGDVKIGDPESQVLAIFQRYGHYRKSPDDLAKFDKADYEYEAEIGPSGIYYFIDRANTGIFYRITRAVLGGLNPPFRRAIGLRRWSVDGRVGLREKRVTIAFAMVMVEGSHEWLVGGWSLARTIPTHRIDRFVNTPGVSWPHDVNHYLVTWWNRLIAMEKQNGGGEGLDSWITPDARDEERQSAHEFRWNCLTSRSGCRTVCDLYPAAVEYASSATPEGKRELCAAPSDRNIYW
jgi:hypothetical protein